MRWLASQDISSYVPLAESAQTASGWASGHGRHNGGFRSKTGRQWRATGVAPADFIRTRRSQAWPASSPTIHYTGCLNYSLFFSLVLILTYILILQARWVSVAGVVVGVPGTLRRHVADGDVTTENTKILLSHDISGMIFFLKVIEKSSLAS